MSQSFKKSKIPDDDVLSDASSVSSDSDSMPLQQAYIPKNKKDLVFFIDFHDGYAFRQLMEFLKLTVTSIPMYFSENGISILQGNGSGSIVVNINIKGHELLTYYFNKDLANTKEEDETYHLVCFNVSKFRDTIKSTARKEGIRIFQYANDTTVHIQVYGGNKNGEGGTSIETQTYTPIQYEMSGFEQSIFQPNCKSPLSEFCNSCGQFGKVKSTKYTNFICYEKGVKVTAYSETGVISMFKKWGECKDDEETSTSNFSKNKVVHLVKKTKPNNKVFNVKIPIDVIKALSKLSNLTNNGIMRIYCEAHDIIRFMVSISYYAELIIYYRTTDEE
jgi:hypothetical protein